MKTPRLLALALLALLLALLPAGLRAQVSSGTDIIIGRVVGPDRRPIEGARVEATSIESQVSRAKLTNAEGQYTILFPDGGGRYRITVRYLGMSPVTLVLERQADEDRLVADVAMTPVVTQLSAVVVQGKTGDEEPAPGTEQKTVAADELSRLGIDPNDIAALIGLVPGVLGIGKSDSLGAGFSVAGQRPDQNLTTLDGTTRGGGRLPTEAVKSVTVVSNAFDVSRGGFSGGLLEFTSQGGTNVVKGSLTYALRDPSLGWGGSAQNSFGNGVTEHHVSGGIGGPLIRNKLFYFGSFAIARQSELIRSLTAADALTLERLGANPDSVSRFLGAVDAYGLSSFVPGIASNGLGTTYSIVTRLDYNLSAQHTLTVRGNWYQERENPLSIDAYSLPQTGGRSSSTGSGVQASVQSQFENGYINSLRAYVGRDENRSSPFLELPGGRVVVASQLADGRTGLTTLSFGGNSGMPQRGTNRNIDLSDELSLLTKGGAHRFAISASFNSGGLFQDQTNNRFGTFRFNSLADFESRTPASFTRTLVPRVRDGTGYNLAFSLADIWRRSAALQLTYGLRLEQSSFTGSPAYNPAIDSLFGHRTDRIPRDVHLSPRVGFTWTVGAGTRPTAPSAAAVRPAGATRPAAPWIITGGVGEFRNRPSTTQYLGAQGATGLLNSQAQLLCIGDGVPVPDFAAYAADAGSIPSACTTAAGTSIGAPTARSNVTLFDPAFGPTRTWTVSLGISKRITARTNVSLRSSYTRGVSRAGQTDLNLVSTPAFTLHGEADRPVYVAPDSIVPATGSIPQSSSRIHPELGQVRLWTSSLSSATRQLTASVNASTARGINLSMGYTISRSRDQAVFSSTAGNPNRVEWAPGAAPHHQINFGLIYPIKPAFEISVFGNVQGASAFTPLVSGDINGDGSFNDRAFVYDPRSAPDTAIANGMTRLLASSTGRVRDCLRSQMGTIATRNSCTGTWSAGLNMTASIRPSGFRLDRRLSLMVSTSNLLTGLDQLFHGADNVHGWGQSSRGDPTLLYVRGFDPAAQRFIYQVNERFGATGRSAQAFRPPFQVNIRASYAIGPDANRDRINQAFGPSNRTNPAADLLARLDQMIPNPVRSIIALRDSLALSAEQVAKLQPLADTLAAKHKIVIDALRETIGRAGSAGDPAAQLNPKLQAARVNTTRALAAAQAILTAEQWAKVPAAIKAAGTTPPPPQTPRP